MGDSLTKDPPAADMGVFAAAAATAIGQPPATIALVNVLQIMEPLYGTEALFRALMAVTVAGAVKGRVQTDTAASMRFAADLLAPPATGGAQPTVTGVGHG